MNAITSVTRYFRQSLIDSEKLCPEDNTILTALNLQKNPKNRKKGDLFEVDTGFWRTGMLKEEEASQIFSLIQKLKGGKKTDRFEEILLIPRIDHIKSEGGRFKGNKREVFIPLMVFAMMDQKGGLMPSDKPPWIPRIWLSPSQGNNQPVGEYDILDHYLARNPFKTVETFTDLVSYSEQMIEKVSGKSFENPIHSSYTPLFKSLILLDLPVVGAKKKIIEIYDKIIEKGKAGPLYKKFISFQNTPTMPMADKTEEGELTQQHVGQMTGEFPLSPKQRIAHHHLIKMDQLGEILAVNGPPGTGKTTLLRTVVANLWVKSALSEKEPPLIVATSSNNQAVTNILESFFRIDEKGISDSLKGRWLPEVSSYGLFCCSKARANIKNPYPYEGPQGEGFMAGIQEKNYLESAEKEFLKNASTFHGSNIDTIEKVQCLLHEKLTKNIRKMEKGIKTLRSFRELDAEIKENFTDFDELLKNSHLIKEKITIHEKEMDQTRKVLNDFYNSVKKRAFWRKFLSFLWFVRKENAYENAGFLNKHKIDLKNTDDPHVELYFKDHLLTVKNKIHRSHKNLQTISSLKKRWESVHENLIRFMNACHIDFNHNENIFNELQRVLDMRFRFTSFKLATHYWEARWLIEIRKLVNDGDSDSKSPIKLLRKFRRYAKLTPLFVSTFYMVPGFFTAFEKKDNTWKNIPLFDEIDLLIIDEAGQALPEVAGASFALSKKALILGDTDQIEPVWSVPPAIDRANLVQCNLFEGEKHYADFFLTSGLLASSGNVMRVAQRQCAFHQFKALKKGLYLTEHRRCFDPIIQYCNDLVYKGILEPLRGMPSTPSPFPLMAFVPSYGKSETRGSSRWNNAEAGFIVQWLLNHRDFIEAYIPAAQKTINDSPNSLLEKHVAIVTPFSKQAGLIKKLLKESDLNGMTVGTVHSLQGDERYFILFSSVYGDGDGDQKFSKFYDRSHNMLNVAVSRAKDGFILFGHPDVFGCDGVTLPSGKLKACLDQIETPAFDHQKMNIMM